MGSNGGAGRVALASKRARGLLRILALAANRSLEWIASGNGFDFVLAGNSTVGRRCCGPCKVRPPLACRSRTGPGREVVESHRIGARECSPSSLRWGNFQTSHSCSVDRRINPAGEPFVVFVRLAWHESCSRSRSKARANRIVLRKVMRADERCALGGCQPGLAPVSRLLVPARLHGW